MRMLTAALRQSGGFFMQGLFFILNFKQSEWLTFRNHINTAAVMY